MRESEVDRLKRRAHQEYERERQALEERHKARLDAIEWLCALNRATDQDRSESNTALIEGVLSELPNSFTRGDVEKAIRRVGAGAPMSRATLAKTLSRLVERAAIAIEVQGRGRRATVYRKGAKKV